MNKPRYLTKSRFKLALDCITKLYYTRHPKYNDSSETDSFLQGLAQGGFQVEELARLYYPDGIAIIGDDWNYDLVAQKTNDLLKRENVTIFEGAFLIDGLFIRVDILKKCGNSIELIEVKAKSINGISHESFFTKKGDIGSEMKLYLYDIAFQQLVIQRCFPQFSIKPYLYLVDKEKQTSVSGLNNHFQINLSSELRTKVEVTPGLKTKDLGSPILSLIPVTKEIEFILSNNPIQPEKSFQEMVVYYKTVYKDRLRIQNDIGAHCKGCEFNTQTIGSKYKNGFLECWISKLPKSILTDYSEKDIVELPKYYDVWYNPVKKANENDKYFMNQLVEDDFNIKPIANGLSRTERQWLQIDKEKTKDIEPYVDMDNLKLEMNQWSYPLNFIDFETSAVAIPFTKGMRPYEQIAFQFSHHTVNEKGEVKHASQYINLDVGVFPNFDFIRALKKSLEQNQGSIFRYHNHENTILNLIYKQLYNSLEPDKKMLMGFIESISHNTGSSISNWKGKRDMIDLQKTILSNYYNPKTKGSNSIKAVLPAILNSSSFLKEKYTQGINRINLTSLNFDDSYTFIKINGEIVSDPYKNLLPLFEGLSNELLEEAVEKASSDVPQIADGGAALFAYAEMQNPDVKSVVRSETKKALLRYCELDTLAMVMIYEHFNELIN